MQVELRYHTPDPERAIATAARLCYAPVGASELMETMPEERVKSVLATIMASGHFSTLEHASYTFAVDGVSRALTHQLVRHRLASYNQQSQRYVKFKNGISVVKPETVAASPETEAVFDEAIAACEAAYQKLLDAGIPAEDGPRKTHVGGQALIEGVMMRGKFNWAVAVREPDGGMYVEDHDLASGRAKNGWMHWPVVRGCRAFVESLMLGYKALEIAAMHAFADEDDESEEK